MQRKTPGFFRALAMLLVVVTVFSLPVSVFAAETDTEAGIVPYASAVKQAMMEKAIFKALLYLGYDSTGYLRDGDHVFEEGYYGGSLLRNHPSSLTKVPYDNNDNPGHGTGSETSSKNTGYLDVVSPTNKYPDVYFFENGDSDGDNVGLDCVDFAAYFLTNYLPNIEGTDISSLASVLTALREADPSAHYTYDHMEFWPNARQMLMDNKVAKVFKVTDVNYRTGEISKYVNLANPSNEIDNSVTDLYSQIESGTLIQMGHDTDPTVHYAIYMGTYNGKHFMAHCGNSERGPEITEVERMAPQEDTSSKGSVPLYFYELKFVTENYGSIEINKKDPNGKNLMGAEFLAQNTSTKVYYETDPTNANGCTIFEDLPLGTYTITETTYPLGHGPGPVTSWTVTLTEDTPNATVTVNAVNYPLSLEIIKNTNTGTNLAGWQFKIFANTPSKEVTLGSSTLNREYRVKITDKDGNVVYSDPAKLTEGPAITIGAPIHCTKNLGETVSFYTAASGTEPLTYLWQTSTDNGETWQDTTETSNRYSFTMTEEADRTLYRYIVTDANGASAISKVHTAHLPTTLAFLEYPADTVSAVGEKATFSFTANGSNIVYQWQESTDGGVTWATRAYGSSITLSKSEDKEVLLRCILNRSATADIPAAQVISDPIRWCRADGFTADGQYDGVQIVTHPQNQQKNTLNQAVTFEVLATGSGLVYEWQYRAEGSDTWVDAPDSVSGINPNAIYTTDDTGKVSIQGIHIGNYYVTELDTGKDGWIYDYPKAVTVTIENTTVNPATVTFTNEFLTLGSLDIIKDTEDGLNKDGWLFNLYGDEGCTDLLMEGLQTDADGKLHIGELVAGDYWVKEMGHIDPAISEIYKCVTDNPAKVTIISGDTVSVTFTNNIKYGKLEIQKETESDLTNAGWLFNLYANEGCSVLVMEGLKTDADGKIVVDKLIVGEYWVKEMGHEDPTLADLCICESENPVKVTITEEIPAAVSFKNSYKKGSLLIQKETNTGANKDGWPFNVYMGSVAPENLLPGSPFVTDTDGKILIEGLRIGTYVVVELDEGKDLWVVDADIETATVTFGGTAEVNFQNTHLGYGQIVKKSTNNGKVSGWPFEIRDAEGALIHRGLTNEYGLITVKLLPGTYTVKEISSDTDPYWVMDQRELTLVIVAGETAEVEFTNRWFGSAKLKKTTTDNSPVAGWSFELRTLDGEVVGTGITDKDGFIDFGLLDPGEYELYEIIPEGSLYQPADGNPKTVFIACGHTTEVNFSNAPRSGSILGYKVSEQGIKLAGAKFLLEWSDDGGETWNPVTSGTEVLPGLCSSEGLVDGCLVSDEEGIIHFTGLHPSLTYRLTEVEAPPGFALAIDSVFTGVLTESADLTATFTIINTETIQIPATGDLVDAPFMTAFFILTALGVLFICAMGTIVTVKKNRAKDDP